MGLTTRDGSINRFVLLCIFCLPLQHLELTSGYGYRLHPTTGKYAFHSGIDLRARHDTVFAVLSGRLASVGYDALTGVHIRLTSGEFTFLYGHLSQVFVLPDDSVRAGTPLGITGATGRVTGEHLHFGITYDGLPLNPLLFLHRLLNKVKQIKQGEKSMNTPFKPLSEQIAGKMIADLKAGTSIFQRPNNSMNSALPFNIESGRRYAGPSALVLIMQKRDDPRWATSNQANRNHTAVVKGATGTLINFMSSYEYQKVVDEKGEPVLKDNGKQRTERVKLNEPKQVDAWLFNGEQLRKLPKWEKEPMDLSPAERAQVILDNSKAVVEHGGDDMFYDTRSDTIVLPEMEQFKDPEQYFAEALHQLAHRISAEDRLNRPLNVATDPVATIREELRTNLASLFLSKELNLPYELNDHVGYVNSWAQILKEEPAELFKAASDAQKIVDHIMAFEQRVEEKQEIAEIKELPEGIGQSGDIVDNVQDIPIINPERLKKGEVIPHNGTEFKVLAELKNNVYNMQDLSDKRKFKMGSNSGLFASLIEARNSSQEISTGMVADQEVHEAEEAGMEQDNEVDNAYQMQR